MFGQKMKMQEVELSSGGRSGGLKCIWSSEYAEEKRRSEEGPA
jgi:hypothetical protein